MMKEAVQKLQSIRVFIFLFLFATLSRSIQYNLIDKSIIIPFQAFEFKPANPVNTTDEIYNQLLTVCLTYLDSINSINSSASIQIFQPNTTFTSTATHTFNFSFGYSKSLCLRQTTQLQNKTYNLQITFSLAHPVLNQPYQITLIENGTNMGAYYYSTTYLSGIIYSQITDYYPINLAEDCVDAYKVVIENATSGAQPLFNISIMGADQINKNLRNITIVNGSYILTSKILRYWGLRFLYETQPFTQITSIKLKVSRIVYKSERSIQCCKFFAKQYRLVGNCQQKQQFIVNEQVTESSNSSKWIIVGSCVGGFFFIVINIAVICFCRKRRSQREAEAKRIKNIQIAQSSQKNIIGHLELQNKCPICADTNTNVICIYCSTSFHQACLRNSQRCPWCQKQNYRKKDQESINHYTHL